MMNKKKQMIAQKASMDKSQANKVKVDTGLFTNDYFTDNCQDPQDLVMVDGARQMDRNGLLHTNQSNDRSEYVQVPPIASRPMIRVRNGSNIFPMPSQEDLQDGTEIFWPLTDTDMMDIE